MEALSAYLFWAGLVFAGLAWVAYGIHAVGLPVGARRLAADTGAGTETIVLAGEHAAGTGWFATALALLTAAALAGSFAARWAAADRAPLSNLYEFTTAFAMGLAWAYVAFETATGLRRAGVVAFALVVGMLLVATRFPSEIDPLVPALRDNTLLTLHVSVMMASYAVLTVAFCGAVIYLAQGGEGGQRFRALPAGGDAGDFAHSAVLAGFPLLGLGIALGAWWANDAWGRYWGWDPKETSALVTWLSIAAYFHARAGTGSVAGAPGIRRLVPERVRRGWRPDPMWWLVAMWGLVLFTYFGVNLWVSGLHSYAGV